MIQAWRFEYTSTHAEARFYTNEKGDYFSSDAIEDGNSYISFRAVNGMLEFYCDTRGFINGRASTITEASTAASSVDEKNCPDHKIIVIILSTVLAVVIFALLLALGYILYVRGRIAQIVQAKQNVKVRFATARHIKIILAVTQ